ncbi:MAG: flagellar filament outer layer protein FlaA [Spirochaetia bacterium]
MKRYLILIGLAILCVSGIGFAVEEVLIDFSTLEADYPQDNPVDDSETILDFSTVAGSRFTEEDKNAMKTSLAIANWEVNLASSSGSIENMSNSMVRSAPVKEDASRFAGETVLGVRVHFPTEPFNSWALIQPPFEIPAYMDKQELQGDGTLVTPQEEQGRGRKFDNFGVIKNIGVVKKIDVNVYGLNFPYGFSIILQDSNNQEQEIYFGDMQFDGWNTLTWENPNYITDVRQRALRMYPIYPKSSPMRKLVGIRIYRDAMHEGGDFIAYVKDINITYDQAILPGESDIDHENLWQILTAREQARRKAELERLGQIQVLRTLEQKKMHQETEETTEDTE